MAGYGSGVKKTKVIKGYKGQIIVESYDRYRIEGTWYIEEEDEDIIYENK